MNATDTTGWNHTERRQIKWPKLTELRYYGQDTFIMEVSSRVMG